MTILQLKGSEGFLKPGKVIEVMISNSHVERLPMGPKQA